ncbi:MAG: glycoside hydrolase family 3 C-terminal domain-containing protein [Alistipes sp.]|nr:glycoside hydrolase family 3 C-terminal domain-containing protein [Alistipes sp.]
MKKLALFAVVALAVVSCCKVDYKDPTQPIEKRVEALLSQMTLEEKVGQMNQFCGVKHVSNIDKKAHADNPDAHGFYPGINADTLRNWTKRGLIGSYLHVLTAEEAVELQELAMQSRLGIPLIFGIDAIHGNCLAPDNTSYPTSIGLACSFDTEMAYKIARQTALEMRAMNMHWTFNPNVDVARDARWGRVGETFGEDPYLVSEMGLASVNGYQGDMQGGDDVLACIKHLIAGSQSINGGNAVPTDVSERTLYEVFLPPYELSVREGNAGSLMMAHNDINGVPCHSSKWLMEDVLRKEYGFDGFIVSDWMDIERLHTRHATATSRKEAFYQSIMAGMDMHMHGIYWNEEVAELVREGRIPMSRIDESVRRILTAKFRLGLFENPFSNVKEGAKIRMCEEHRATALEAAENSIVLLKNDGILPLDVKKYKRVLVTGINADDENIMGDWSAPQKPENVTTILEGLREVAPQTNFIFVNQGLSPKTMKSENIEKAARIARTTDLNIVVAGETSLRARSKIKTCGENQDRATIDLFGLQKNLVRKVAESGKPTILVIVAGRPQAVVWESEHLPAIVCAWEPGMLGGKAVAKILYGEVNPSAKLAITIPRHEGQIQMYYNHKKSTMDRYRLVDMPTKPLYPFGYGLSYTTYEYSDLSLSKSEIAPDESIEASVTVKNTGARDGVEIAQLYINDCYSEVTRPVKELKGFQRVALKAGESKRITFTLTPKHLEYYNLNMERVVEPGRFEVMVGGSSQDKDLLTTEFEVK